MEEDPEDYEQEGHGRINYQEILGLKDSYAESLDKNYENERDKIILEKEKEIFRLKEKCKRGLVDLVIISGCSYGGYALIGNAISNIESKNSSSYASYFILGLGFGLLAEGFRRGFVVMYDAIKNRWLIVNLGMWTFLLSSKNSENKKQVINWNY